MPTCSKRKYEDYRGAERVLSRLRKRQGYRGLIYRCAVCQFLHLGRKRKDARKDYLLES